MLAAARDELLSRLEHFALKPTTVVDIGGNVLLGDEALRRKFPRARILATQAVDRTNDESVHPSSINDISRAMGFFDSALRRVFGRALGIERSGSTLEQLTLADDSVDLVIANLWQPGAEFLDAALLEISRVLAPNGLFLWSTLGPGTEVTREDSVVEQVELRAEYPSLIDMHDLGSALGRAGFIEPVLDIDRQTHRGLPIDLGRHHLATGAHFEIIHAAAFGGQKGAVLIHDETVVPIASIGRRSHNR